MNISKEEVFKKTTEQLLNAYKNEVDEEKHDSMRLLFIMKIDTDKENSLLAESMYLNPAPPPSRWVEIFSKIAKEVPRTPLFITVVNRIHYALVHPLEALDDKELLEFATEGYLVMNISVEDGELVGNLYNKNFEKLEGGEKHLSLFDIEAVKAFPPALAVLSLVVFLLTKESFDKKEEELPKIDINHTVTIHLNDEEDKGDGYIEGVDYNTDKDDTQDESPDINNLFFEN